jgi:hypothetical protein
MNKWSILFDPNENKELIEEIIQIEHRILEYYTVISDNSRKAVNKIESQLLNGNIKIHKNGVTNKHNHSDIINNQLALKISGIWENNKYMGITYKFIEVGETTVGETTFPLHLE